MTTVFTKKLFQNHTHDPYEGLLFERAEDDPRNWSPAEKAARYIWITTRDHICRCPDPWHGYDEWVTLRGGVTAIVQRASPSQYNEALRYVFPHNPMGARDISPETLPSEEKTMRGILTELMGAIQKAIDDLDALH